jgi:hypothetical protein
MPTTPTADSSWFIVCFEAFLESLIVDEGKRYTEEEEPGDSSNIRTVCLSYLWWRLSSPMLLAGWLVV